LRSWWRLSLWSSTSCVHISRIWICCIWTGWRIWCRIICIRWHSSGWCRISGSCWIGLCLRPRAWWIWSSINFSRILIIVSSCISRLGASGDWPRGSQISLQNSILEVIVKNDEAVISCINLIDDLIKWQSKSQTNDSGTSSKQITVFVDEKGINCWNEGITKNGSIVSSSPIESSVQIAVTWVN